MSPSGSTSGRGACPETGGRVLRMHTRTRHLAVAAGVLLYDHFADPGPRDAESFERERLRRHAPAGQTWSYANTDYALAAMISTTADLGRFFRAPLDPALKETVAMSNGYGLALFQTRLSYGGNTAGFTADGWRGVALSIGVEGVLRGRVGS